MLNNTKPKEIAKSLAARIIEGHTLAQIGNDFGVTGEYIRQIGAKFGIPTDSRKFKVSKGEKLRIAALNRQMAKYGMSMAEIKELNEKYGNNILGNYKNHKFNSKRRGIQFNLSFKEWWAIWKDHYAQRGRSKDKLVMGRFGDVGAYEVGNVYLVSLSDNFKEFHKNKLTRAK